MLTYFVNQNVHFGSGRIMGAAQVTGYRNFNENDLCIFRPSIRCHFNSNERISKSTVRQLY